METRETQEPAAQLQVDIVSDVVCPWCVIGFKQFEIALGRVGAAARIRWRAFELNPDMPAAGQDLAEHVALKYGSTPEQSQAARARIAKIGAAVGIAFNYTPETRMRNTFRAHQLLRWAGTLGKKHALKMALFDAFFTQGRNVDDGEALTAVAEAVGLDRGEAAAVLADGRYAQAVREEEGLWTRLGIQGVPTFIFNESQLITGAQPVEVFEKALRRLLAAPQADV